MTEGLGPLALKTVYVDDIACTDVYSETSVKLESSTTARCPRRGCEVCAQITCALLVPFAICDKIMMQFQSVDRDEYVIAGEAEFMKMY